MLAIVESEEEGGRGAGELSRGVKIGQKANLLTKFTSLRIIQSLAHRV